MSAAMAASARLFENRPTKSWRGTQLGREPIGRRTATRRPSTVTNMSSPASTRRRSPRVSFLRFINYERADLWIGIVVVILGAAALFGFSTAVFGGRPEAGNFTNAAGVAAGLGHYVSRLAGDLFAIALLDASIIGAAAVGLATAYASSDVLGFNHSLHRPVTKAKGFYLCYAALMAAAATLVLLPGAPLGLLTEGVQTLAGDLLPSATVFLLLLCNDKAVLGPWVNSTKLNIFTAAVVWVLVLLSVVLTASVLFPDISSGAIVAVLGGGTLLGLVGGTYLLVRSRRSPTRPSHVLGRRRCPRRCGLRHRGRHRRRVWSSPCTPCSAPSPPPPKPSPANTAQTANHSEPLLSVQIAVSYS